MGSLISTFITPLLRAHVGFWLAFGVPAVLLVISTVIFWAGHSTYRIVPPGANVIAQFAGVLWTAAKARLFRGAAASGDWLELASARYGPQAVSDARATLRIMVVFVPLPAFWALFDQHASTWVQQAKQMDRHIGAWELEPEQIQVLNPFFIIVLAPLWDRVLYPLFRRWGVDVRPLRRMTAGMLLTACSYVVAGFLQLRVDESEGEVNVGWQAIAYFVMTLGEVLVSVSGLEFAYSQAPARMKSVSQALWLLTVAVGNALVAAVAAAVPLPLASLLFAYAALMVSFCVLFIVLTRNYQYVEASEPEPARPEDAEDQRLLSQ